MPRQFRLSAIQSQDGEKVTIVEVLKRTAEELPSRADLDPVTREALLDAIGRTYVGLGFPQKAVEVLEQAPALCRDHLGADQRDTLGLMNDLGAACLVAGRFMDALPLLEKTLELRKARLGPEHPETLSTMNNLAKAHLRTGRLTDGLALCEETVRRSRRRVRLRRGDRCAA